MRIDDLMKIRRFCLETGMTLLEVMIASGVAVIGLWMVLLGTMKGLEIGKWQSAYETACTYGEQAVEYALYVPYSDLSNSNSIGSVNWVSNSLLYSSATSTNFIQTTQNGSPITMTNITYLATQTSLPLDDLGSYIVQRKVNITDRSVIEPASTNLNYKVITVSNTWVFLGRTMPPIVYKTIRDAP